MRPQASFTKFCSRIRHVGATAFALLCLSVLGLPVHAQEAVGELQAGPEESLDFVYLNVSRRENRSQAGPPIPDKLDEPRSIVVNPKMPIAENVDLSMPVAIEPTGEGIDIGVIAPPVEPELMVYAQPSLYLLGAEVAAGTSTRLSWSPDSSIAGIAAPTPVLVVNGTEEGPTMCLTAAIHGDELNGIEVVRRVLYDLDPKQMSGAVIGVPIVNLQGFQRSSRYLPDRRDLNRYFPGNPRGSSASRLAYSFFNEVIMHCDSLVDLHTGSFHRTNLPQLRADLHNPDIAKLSKGFGATVVLHSAGAPGTLRRAAADAGIPALTLEAGEPQRVQEDAVSHGAKGVLTLLSELGMSKNRARWDSEEAVYYRSRWIRSDRGGVLFSKVALGDSVERGQVLGTVTDPITNVQSEIHSSETGRVLGMALNQFVMPGFAAFRIGIDAPPVLVPEPLPASEDVHVTEMNTGDHSDDVQSVADTFEEDEATLDARDSLEDSE